MPAHSNTRLIIVSLSHTYTSILKHRTQNSLSLTHTHTHTHIHILTRTVTHRTHNSLSQQCGAAAPVRGGFCADGRTDGRTWTTSGARQHGEGEGLQGG